MLVTSIGSLPFTDVEKALDAVFACCPEAPFWPQLPRRSFLEDMYVQGLEGVPALVTDAAKGTVYMDTRKTEGIERFYEDAANGNIAAFAVSQAAAPGFYGLLERLKTRGRSVRLVKGQMTGPFTLGIGLKDENGRPIVYNGAYFDIIKKAIRMKAAWMIDAIKSACPGKEVVIFFDEPAMVSLGSAYVSVSREAATAMIDEVTEGLDATIGVHCCGNTDWPALLLSGLDIINYDAFNFMETLFYFPGELTAFLARGGHVAPGIVPSSAEGLAGTDVYSLARSLRAFEGYMREAGLPPGADEIVTTACGLGSLSEAGAYRALDLLKNLPDAAKTLDKG